jgi:hypothetical protein
LIFVLPKIKFKQQKQGAIIQLTIHQLTRRVIVKKLILVAVLLLTVSSLSFGQLTANTNANVTANVVASITITNTAGLTIGNVNLGQTVTVTSLAAGAAAFTVQGPANASTTVAVTFPTNLTNGTNNLPFTGQTPRSGVTNAQAASTALGSLTGGTATTTAAGQLWLWVGGGVTADPVQPAGSYTGTINVAVSQP